MDEKTMESSYTLFVANGHGCLCFYQITMINANCLLENVENAISIAPLGMKLKRLFWTKQNHISSSFSVKCKISNPPTMNCTTG